jgi:hypothetical protein
VERKEKRGRRKRIKEQWRDKYDQSILCAYMEIIKTKPFTMYNQCTPIKTLKPTAESGLQHDLSFT